MKKEQRKLLLQAKLNLLIQEHRDLDEAIARIIESGSADMLLLQRMKKRKLILKDEIRAIKKTLVPDILA